VHSEIFGSLPALTYFDRGTHDGEVDLHLPPEQIGERGLRAMPWAKRPATKLASTLKFSFS